MQTHTLFLLCLALALAACHSSSNTNGGTAACPHTGEVKDLTSLDACGLVIVSDKGEQFMPADMAVPGITLAAGQKVRFGYTDMPDAMSACMAGKIVRITCLEVLGGGSSEVPNVKDCLDIADPMAVEWMKKAILATSPDQVLKYKYRTDGWAYFFRGQHELLYDCQGTLLCERKPGEKSASCDRKIEEPQTGTIIWQGEGMPE